MVITNMPGGGAKIATSTVREVEPDGCTMLLGHTGHMIVTEVLGLADCGIEDFEICCAPAIDKDMAFVASAASPCANIPHPRSW